MHQDPATRRYRLGVALHGLALAAPSPLEQLTELRPLLEGLAQRTGETAYLMLRQGDEVLCIARAEGAAPIRTLLIEVGAYRPIGADASPASPCWRRSTTTEVEDILKRTAAAMAPPPQCHAGVRAPAASPRCAATASAPARPC